MDKNLYNDRSLKKKNKCFISFGKLNRYYIIPFICPFIIFFRSLFLKLSNFNKNGYESTFQYEFNESLKCSACGMLFFISYLISRRENEQKETKDNDKEKKRNDEQNYKNNKLKIFLLITIMVIFYIIFIYNSEIYTKKHKSFQIRVYYLIFNTFLGKFILKEDIVSHQILSLILVIFGFLFISIPAFIEMTKTDFLLNFFILLLSISYPVYIVTFKYIIDKYYISPFLLILLIGVYLLVISLSVISFFSLKEYHNLSQLSHIFDFSENNLYFLIAFCIGTIAKVFFCFILLYFSPNLFILTYIVGTMIIWIYNSFTEKIENKKYLIFEGIGHCIILISALIYNELIILNFCELNKNTKKYINERKQEEEDLLKKEINENNNNLVELDGYYYDPNEDGDIIEGRE